MSLNSSTLPFNLPPKKLQQGSALVIAIFVLVVILGFGLATVQMVTSNANTLAYEVISTRAYFVANAGMQWRLNKLFDPINGDRRCNDNAVASPLVQSPTNSTFTMPTSSIIPLQCEAAVVACEDFVHQDVVYYRLNSSVSCTIDGENITRTIEVEAQQLN